MCACRLTTRTLPFALLVRHPQRESEKISMMRCQTGIGWGFWPEGVTSSICGGKKRCGLGQSRQSFTRSTQVNEVTDPQ